MTVFDFFLYVFLFVGVSILFYLFGKLLLDAFKDLRNNDD